MPAAGARSLKRVRIFQRFSARSRKPDRGPATSSPQERRIPAFGLAPKGGCMAGCRDACLIAALTVEFAATGGGTPARAEDQASTRQGQVCGGDESARGTVGKIVDGRTFVLDDGREVRLAAIEVAPLAGPQDRTDRTWPAAAAALGAQCCGGRRTGPIATVAYSPTPIRYGTVMSSCCSKNLWPRVLPGSAPASQIRAPDTFWTVKGRPGRLNLAYGPIRIMRCSTPRRRRIPWRGEANLH